MVHCCNINSKKGWSYRLSYKRTMSSGSLYTLYTAYKVATPQG